MHACNKRSDRNGLTHKNADFRCGNRTIPEGAHTRFSSQEVGLNSIRLACGIHRPGIQETELRAVRDDLFWELFQPLEEPLSINLTVKSYVACMPASIFALWEPSALQWADTVYHSEPMRRVRERYIEIYTHLKEEPRGPRRSHLVEEASQLPHGLSDSD